RKVKPEEGTFCIWDTKESGLCLRVQPSGHRSFKFVYSHRGRSRWYDLGEVGLADARRRAARLRSEVAEGKDPAAERQEMRRQKSFAALAEDYLKHAMTKNKSWRQADKLVRSHLLPRWANLDAASIKRADVKALMREIDAPVMANQVLAAASAIFSFAIKEE